VVFLHTKGVPVRHYEGDEGLAPEDAIPVLKREPRDPSDSGVDLDYSRREIKVPCGVYPLHIGDDPNE
jgi:hypothetical protein